MSSDIKERLQKHRKYGGVYYDRKWRKARKKFLERNPLCVMCLAEGKYYPADVVDHIEPHRGDRDLFWGEKNWQGLCKHHHDSDKQRMEKGGDRGIGEDGLPLDQNHHWNN